VRDVDKSVERQADGARAFITKKGWTLDDAHIYMDDGVSGALFADRPQFQRLMRDAEEGAFDAIVFFDLDRFGRHAQKTMAALYRLADFGVEVWDYSTGQRIDVESFDGELITQLKSLLAEQNRQQGRKHTRSSLWRKAEQGLVTGGRTFGYDDTRIGKGETRLVVNEAEAAVVRQIYTRLFGRRGPALDRQGAERPEGAVTTRAAGPTQWLVDVDGSRDPRTSDLPRHEALRCQPESLRPRVGAQRYAREGPDRAAGGRVAARRRTRGAHHRPVPRTAR
jgi:DNA invertase Pin-like site-specific DNA recombinase